MQHRRLKPVRIGYEPGHEVSKLHLDALVWNLNKGLSDFSEMRLELRRLVSVWLESGPNLAKLFKNDPELERRTMHGRTLLTPTKTGRGHLHWQPEIPDEDIHSQKDLALNHFMGLIANPAWELLGGPCTRCKNYYLKNTKGQKSYCSRTCSSAATAIPATKIRRQREHAEKIKRAQEFIHKWAEAKRRLDWKSWVCSQTGYTGRWLTRAVNQRLLRPPTIGI